MVFGLLCMLLLCARALADESPAPFEDSTLRRMITLPGTGRQIYYYAQNDPIWSETRYELKNGKGLRRTFGGGGCNPTALAMVVAGLVDEQDLPRIAAHTKDGRPIAFCQGTISGFFCKNHEEDETLLLTEPEQYRKLLPLVFGHYACYNNEFGRRFRLSGTSGGGGTTYKMFDPIAEMYGLTLTSTRELDEALTALDEGSGIVVLCGGERQPFSDASGHFVVLGDYDEEALYILDPQVVDDYPKDKRHALEFVEGEPGLLRVSREKVDRLCVSYYFIFSNTAQAVAQ